MAVFFIKPPWDVTTGNHQFGPLVERLRYIEDTGGGDGRFRKKYDQGVAGADSHGMVISGIKSFARLLVNRDPVMLQEFNRPIRAAAIDCIDFVKVRKGKQGDIRLASFEFIPNH